MNNKEMAGKSDRSGHVHKVAFKNSKEKCAKAEEMLPPGSWQRVAAGVAAAAGGGLIAAAMVGVGPAAIAGAAGYLAYRGLSEQKKNDETGLGGKH